jgi:hypothetical protein
VCVEFRQRIGWPQPLWQSVDSSRGPSWCASPEEFCGSVVVEVAGTFAQLEKARLVAKLKAGRDRKLEAYGKCEGRKSYAEAMPDTVALAKQLHTDELSFRKIAAELAARGRLTGSGKAACGVG